MMNNLSVSKNVILYYGVLIIAFFFLMRPNVELPLVLRIVMLVLSFAPIVFNYGLLPFSLLCFYGISSCSFCKVLPSATLYYVIIVVGVYLLYHKKGHFVIRAIPFFLYFLIIALINFDVDESLAWFFMIILMIDMIKGDEDLELIFIAFIVISLFLSVLFFTHYSEFLSHYGKYDSDLERSGWINPNSFGAAIGAGGVLSVAYITRIIKIANNKFLYIVCVITSGLSLIAVSLNASRGAFFAFVIPSIMMLLFSRTPMWVKVIVGFFVLLFTIWLYKNSVFDLITMRLGEDSVDSAGNRTFVWQSKLLLFLQEGNIFYWLFGMGQTNCLYLGFYFSTHNDFVTALIAYGVIGFILFSYVVVFYPIKVMSKHKNWSIAILLLFVVFECFVLEPFFRGKLIVMMYYVFTLKYAMIHSGR